MLRFLGLCLTSSLIVRVAAAEPRPEPRSLTLADATAVAMTNNLELRSLATNVAAARARLAGASIRLTGNPTLTTTAGPRSSPSEETLDYGFQVLQPLEIAGQRRARIDSATAGLGAIEAQLQALRVEVAARVEESFGRAVAAEQRAQLAEEALVIARQGVNAAEERFRAGAAALLEVNTARVEIGRLARARGNAARDRAEAFADLQQAVGLDPLDGVTPQPVPVRAEPVAAPDELIQEALANRAEIRASSLALDAARAQARLASREWIPSPSIGVGFTKERESDTGILQGILSFDLPLFNRNQAARGEAAARILELEIAREATDRRVRQDVLTAVARVQAASAAADGYASDVVKAMEENLALSAESYRAGKIDFLQLLVIRRQTLEARGEHIDVLEELNAARAQLNRAVGRTHSGVVSATQAQSAAIPRP